MKNFLLKLPIPVSAIGLSFAGLAGLFAEYGLIKNSFMIVSCLILISVIIKFFLNPTMFKEQLNQAPIAATFPTFYMALAFLSKLFLPIHYYTALILWLVATIGHCWCIISFTKKFAIKRDLSLVLPSWFIVYVGIVASAIAAPVFNIPILIRIAQLILVFGFVSFFVLLPIITKRVKVMPLPEPLQATFCIFAAPASLNLVGYLAITINKNFTLIVLQAILALILYIIVLINLFSLVKKDFSPAQAALTFPLVISATAIKLSTGVFVSKMASLASISMFISYLALIIAVLVVFIVFIRYLNFTRNAVKK